MGMIKIENVTFQYDGMLTPIFANLNLNIDQHWRMGLIGRNGRGKTTFLRLLLGQLQFTGQIQTNLTFKYFPEPVPDATQMTSDILLRQAQLADSELWRIQSELPDLQVADEVLWRPFETLSPGEQTKVQLAALFCQPNTFQLIDEPTNHLDAVGRTVIANYLRKKQGFIVVSHDRQFINQVIDHVLSIDRAQIELLAGNYDTWQAAYDNQNAAETKAQSKLQHEIKSLTRSSAQTKQWAGKAEQQKQKNIKQDQHANLDKGFLGHKAAKMMKRSKMAAERSQQAIQDKKQLLQNVDDVPELTMNYQPAKTNTPLLTVNDLQVKRGQQWLAQPVSFEISNHDRLILSGENGAGKSSLLAALLPQATIEYRGTINWAHQAKVSYVAQSFEQLSGSLTAYAEKNGVAVDQFFNLLRKLGFERAYFQTPMQELSMGQKRKVSLARSLCEPANLYIWDEPLNYLDVITRQQIEDLILTVAPAMLIIDHDQLFVEHVATQPAIEI